MSNQIWKKLFRLAVLDLKIQPSEFWNLSFIELKTLLGEETIEPVVNKAELQELQNLFPDQQIKK